MVHTAVLGAQWGDEGKGKIVDYLAKYYDLVVRCQGGNNAGHTVVIDKERYAFHLLPSAVTRPNVTCVLGNGMVINPEVLVQEIDNLKSKIKKHAQIFVSDRAYVITQQCIDEDLKDGKKIGTTGRGIGPAYRSKINRTGIRMHQFLNSDEFPQSLRDRLRPYVIDTGLFLSKQLEAGKYILFEGAQATMLDVDHGTVPFVTASNTTVGGLFTGSGIFVSDIKIIGVAKAYTTRVGEGPFPTELKDELGEQIRVTGNEYGTTTGRPRRCGWLDTGVLKQFRRVNDPHNGAIALALTKLDVLNGINPIKVCTGYSLEGQRLEGFPADLDILEKSIPIYEELPGWTEDISKCKTFNELPRNARNYIQFIEEQVGIPVKLIGVGPEREQLILK